MKKKKLFLIAGSTGGHALPIFDIYNELKRNYKIKIFVSGSAIENQIFKGAPTVYIISGKLDRHNLARRVWGLICFFLGFVQSFFYLLFNRPKLIMAKGGFLAVPLLVAAKILRIPYFTHESDSEMGLANKKFGLSAKKLFVGFPTNMYEEKIAKVAIYSGQIIRKDFVNSKLSNKNGNKIFITGGSLGSRKINKQIFEILPELLKKYEVFHQLGGVEIESLESSISKITSEEKKYYHSFGFSLDQSRSNFLNADLIISRAGATTIGEIAALSKASILIPYPYASADHQNKNAKFLEKSGSAIVIKEDVLNNNNLLDRINYLFSDSNNLAVLGKKISQAIKFTGLQVISDEIKKFMEG